VKRVLIANRGEIALRIIRTLRRLGLEAVIAASDDDLTSPAARAADRVVRLGAGDLSSTYLNIERLVELARESACDAVHPGYGFLSENPTFAQAVREAGLTFIGPNPEALRLSGSKTESRRAMRQAGVPVIPGFHPAEGESEQEICERASELGFPVLIKAVAGGGGKGMRAVYSEEELPEALAGARREAENAFGDPRIYLEKLITSPRHIEVQVVADEHGNLFVLGERECSIQRRHQKIVEESPSPLLTHFMREKLFTYALSGMRAIGYTNAGTVEFLYSPQEDEFYFLEINARLQVEHPVTELVSGLDLVELQIRVARGEKLSLPPWQPRGHAIEARLYAEDPASGFLPSPGKLSACRFPHHPQVRIDTGVEEGSQISPLYDPLIAKLIAHGEDRPSTIAALRQALRETVVLGVTTNRSFLIDLLAHPDFVAGHLSVDFIERHKLRERAAEQDVPPEMLAILAAAINSSLEEEEPAIPKGEMMPERATIADPWRELRGWRG